MLRRALCATVAALAVAVPAHAQTEARAPDDYALVNARIVVAPGRVIERGTIHVSDGRIIAVGERVDVPAGVAQLDLSGRTVYPGLIDAATTTGLPRMGGGGGRGRGGPPAGPPAAFQQAQQAEQARPAPPPEVRPSQMAADVFAPAEEDLEAFRAAGVTTLGLAYEAAGLLPGQTSVVSAGSGEPSELVLRTPVSLQVTFGRRRGAYPGTLMGAVAYLKQAFYDAEHDRRVLEAFQRNPATAPRPTYDAEHRALAPVIAGTLPVWVVGSTERDLARAVDLMRELRVQNYAIVGATEGYRALELLKAAGKPVIVSLNFPQPGGVTGRAFELHVAPAEGEDTVAAAADSAVARAVRGNAAALQRAGVTFALASYGLPQPSQLRERMLAAVEAGLAPDDALRALTVTPARILGLESVIGTIEPGKLANLVVVEGDLFSRQGRIRQVFVEGERFEVRPPAAGRGGGRGGRGAAAAEAAVSVAGDWTGSLEGPNGTTPFTLTLATAAGDSVTGRLASEMGPVDLRGELTGRSLILRGTATPPGRNAMDITITARITGDDLRGTYVAGGAAEVPFNARRRGPGGERDAAPRGGER